MTTVIVAVEVGVKWSVRGCCLLVPSEEAGFGSALIWERKFISRNLACNSMTVAVSRGKDFREA